MELALIHEESLVPTELFNGKNTNEIDGILEKIKDRALSHVPDLTTADGRKAIASLSRKISSSKTTLDGMGKDLVSGEKARLKLIDNSRKHCRDFLDALRDEVRKPLTDWEAEEARIEQEKAEKEQARMDYIELIIGGIAELAYNLEGKTAQEADFILTNLLSIDIDDTFDEFVDRAQTILDASIEKARSYSELRHKFENEQFELNKQREIQEEAQRKIQEQQDKLNAQQREIDAQAERVRIEAEAKVNAEREAREKVEREQAELKQKQIEEDKQRKADEDEQLRIASLAPDKEKLHNFIAIDLSVLYAKAKNMELSEKEAQIVQGKILSALDNIEQKIKGAINNL